MSVQRILAVGNMGLRSGAVVGLVATRARAELCNRLRRGGATEMIGTYGLGDAVHQLVTVLLRLEASLEKERQPKRRRMAVEDSDSDGDDSGGDELRSTLPHSRGRRVTARESEAFLDGLKVDELKEAVQIQSHETIPTFMIPCAPDVICANLGFNRHPAIPPGLRDLALNEFRKSKDVADLTRHSKRHSFKHSRAVSVSRELQLLSDWCMACCFGGAFEADSESFDLGRLDCKSGLADPKGASGDELVLVARYLSVKSTLDVATNRVAKKGLRKVGTSQYVDDVIEFVTDSMESDHTTFTTAFADAVKERLENGVSERTRHSPSSGESDDSDDGSDGSSSGSSSSSARPSRKKKAAKKKKKKSSGGGGSKKEVCHNWFRKKHMDKKSAGCSRKSCKFRHSTKGAKEVAALKKKLKKN